MVPQLCLGGMGPSPGQSPELCRAREVGREQKGKEDSGLEAASGLKRRAGD